MFDFIQKILLPDERAVSVDKLPYERYFAEGIRGVIFDIDNTLVIHGAPAGWHTIRLMEHLKSLGLTPFILSNNRAERVQSFAGAVGADCVYKAGKPGRDGYLRACESLGLRPDQVLAVGDQIFTDILGAKRAGIRSVLVEPIDPREELQIKIKRKLEKPLLSAYQRNKRRQTGRNQ